SHFLPDAPEELWPTLALYYNQSHADMFAESHRLPRERLRVVGNPELDVAIARRARPIDPAQRANLIRSIGLDLDLPILCHIEDAFVEQKFWTEAQRLQYIRE